MWKLRLLVVAGAFVVSASAAHADSVTITSGAINRAWDESPSGIELIGPGTDLIAEDTETGSLGMQAGDVEDLSSTVYTSTPSHSVTVTVNGSTYSSVWVKGQLAISATRFTVPQRPVDTVETFSTPITMTGEFSGYTDQAMTNLAFTVSLNGRGIASIGPLRVVVENTYVLRSGGTAITFTGPLQPPWSARDVGSVGQSGVASFDNGTYYVSGAGSDIWGTADSFEFVHQALDGDGQIVARVTSVGDTNVFAKAGVMLRGSLASNAADVILDMKPSGEIEFMTRSRDGAATAYLGGDTQAPIAWLRLARSGSTVTAAVSADGASWRSVGSTSFAARGTVVAGLAVTSHDDPELNTSTFDHVSVTTSAGTGSHDIVVYASDVPASGRHGAWAAVADPTAAAHVKLATPDNGVSNVSAPLAAPADYVDVTFTANAATPYMLWLRMQATANSKWNDSLWVQFSDATAGESDVYRIGTESGLLVNLATDSAAASLNGWGWQNTAYWLSQQTSVTFASSGAHTLRIQVREDGVQFDQIVLSPSTYASTAPGPVTNDSTIVPKP